MRRVSSCLTIAVLLVSCVCFAASAPTAKPKTWAQLAELTPANRNNKDGFGVSAAISGDTVIVGAFDSNIETTGTAYVFVKPSGGWGNMTQTAVLTPSDGGAGFGTSVAISGDTIIVGAANASNLDSQTPQQQGPGSAYVFVKPQTGWTDMTETAKLTASDGANGDCLASPVCGDRVRCAGTRLFVGWECLHSGYFQRKVNDCTVPCLAVSEMGMLVRRAKPA